MVGLASVKEGSSHTNRRRRPFHVAVAQMLLVIVCMAVRQAVRDRMGRVNSGTDELGCHHPNVAYRNASLLNILTKTIDIPDQSIAKEHFDDSALNVYLPRFHVLR